MPMQNLVKPPQALSNLCDLPTVGTRSAPFFAISTAGRKLIQQAEIVAPHLQFAIIEGEPGVGKQAFAQLLHSRSTFARSNFNRCDAREWLLTADDPRSLAGFTYLDRVDLLGAPGQALLLRVLKALQNRSDGTFALVASSERSPRDLASEGHYLHDLAFRLTAIRFVIPPLRERREDIAPLAASSLNASARAIACPDSAWRPARPPACCNTTGPPTRENFPASLNPPSSVRPMD